MEENDLYFGEDGEIASWVENKMNYTRKLEGIEADVFLASKYAGETHGNYCAETLFSRAGLHEKYKITIEKI